MSDGNVCQYCDICDDEQDCEFDLEKGLQTVRRSLIQRLDNFEPQFCMRCRRFLCLCDRARLTPPRSPSSESYDYRVIARPSATRLRRPELANDVESWVRASTSNHGKTESPGCKSVGHIDQLSCPVSKSIWDEYKKNTPSINTSTLSLASNVEDFFKSFSARMYADGNRSAYEQNRLLMQQIRLMAEKKAQKAEEPEPDTSSHQGP